MCQPGNSPEQTFAHSQLTAAFHFYTAVMFGIFLLLIAASGLFYWAPDLAGHGNLLARGYA